MVLAPSGGGSKSQIWRQICAHIFGVPVVCLATASNGPVEGQVNRLKVIKRQMYGRAGFQLLRARVLDLN